MRVVSRFLLPALIGSIVLLGSTGSTASEDVQTGSISGTVRDGEGKPVLGAMVIVVNRQLGAFSDSAGMFIIRRVPVGTVALRASQYPFRSMDRENINVAAGRTTTVDLALMGPEDGPLFTGASEPCDDPFGGDPEKESLVQIGVRSEKREGKQVYIYKIVNRSRDTLTEIRIGYDARRGHCELTGSSPHVVPDTAYGPPGWVCTPVQGGDPTTFALSWKVASGRDGLGIPPMTSTSDFIVATRARDAQYAECHWLASTAREQESRAGKVRPGRDVDAIPMATGVIAGTVMDQSGSPVPNAAIWLWHAGQSVNSDSNGTYAMPAVPIGQYTMMARRANDEVCWKNRVRVDADRTSSVDFHLSAGALVIPCTAYAIARERLDVSFPTRAIDTHRARFLNRGGAMSPRRPGEDPRPTIYSLTSHDIEIVYRGLGKDTATRAFVAQVHREFRNPEEERLLRIAEEVYPPTKAVLSLADRHLDRKALLREKRLWWYGEFDGVRLPYAVTTDAVRYYLAITQALARGDRSKTGGFGMKQTDFSYTASVSPGPTTYAKRGQTFENVYVVELSLEWSDYCGSLCACGFGLDRTVLLRPDGTLVCVFGDRKPNVIVS